MPDHTGGCKNAVPGPSPPLPTQDAAADPALGITCGCLLALGKDLPVSCCLLRISCVPSLGLGTGDTEMRVAHAGP